MTNDRCSRCGEWREVMPIALLAGEKVCADCVQGLARGDLVRGGASILGAKLTEHLETHPLGRLALDLLEGHAARKRREGAR